MHHSYFNYHGYNASSTSLINTNATPKHDHSYHKQHIRKQNQRYNSYHQQEPLEEWMFGVTEDDHEDYGMTRASPQESPISPSSSSSSTGSLKSSFSRKNTLGNNSRATVTFSHVVLEHPVQQQKPQRQLQQLFSQASASSTSSLGLLPSISESGSQATVTLGTPSTTFSATSSKQHQQQSAKQSLMRIAHCTKSDDGWCSQKAGQYTRHYANASTRGVRTEGRRTGRF
ncbi:hypothetical protein BGZ46_002186 [Entomortierella lignicola]|nr:hypothetical protein BGZ46_002186 [Entomortierella lignicola]